MYYGWTVPLTLTHSKPNSNHHSKVLNLSLSTCSMDLQNVLTSEQFPHHAILVSAFGPNRDRSRTPYTYNITHTPSQRANKGGDGSPCHSGLWRRRAVYPWPHLQRTARSIPGKTKIQRTHRLRVIFQR